MNVWPGNGRRKALAAATIGVVAALGVAACGSSERDGRGRG